MIDEFKVMLEDGRLDFVCLEDFDGIELILSVFFSFHTALSNLS